MNPEIVNLVLLPGLLGMIGGVVRGFVGLLKALSLRRRILWSYWIITAVVAAIIGVFTGIIFIKSELAGNIK